ncbi:MAG: type II toxin-antitoxin system HicA family toxin [Candidatus Aenigmarchaeota archaeon]|nr:type II toxin-antitoxin system HicA family toxin [Candidatus Aenigmarchaeota archaeon]
MRLVPIAVTTLVKTLQKLGFNPVRQKGSHLILQHSDGRSVPIPVHGKGEINPPLLKGILREAKVSREEFFKLLKEILVLLGIVLERSKQNVNRKIQA